MALSAPASSFATATVMPFVLPYGFHAATRDLEQYDVQLNALEQRHGLAQTLQDHAWNDIDAYGVEEEIASLQQRVDEPEQPEP